MASPTWHYLPAHWPRFEKVSVAVNRCEFDLDNRHVDTGTLVAMPGMSAFWDQYGGFPALYFVREEEVAVWRVVKDALQAKTHKVVLAGSDGVGKSLLVAQIALYIAHTMQQRVLLIRQLKLPGIRNAVVLIDRLGAHAYAAQDVADLPGLIHSQSAGTVVLVDGYSQQETKQYGLLAHTLLATSDPYDLKANDFATIVVLSAWTLPQLVCYAQLTNWAPRIGLFGTESLRPPPSETPLGATALLKLAKQHYFFSGGSLRDFCQPRTRIHMVIASALWSGHGRRLSRDFIANGDDPGSCKWLSVVDSELALQQLVVKAGVTMRGHVAFLEDAEAIGEPKLIAATYRQLFHHRIYESVHTTRTPWKAPSVEVDARLQSCVTTVLCSGISEATCLEQLQSLRGGVYWMPAYPGCVPVHAIMPCKIFWGRAVVGNDALALVFVTTRRRKQWKQHQVDKVVQAIQSNHYLPFMTLVVVVVTRTDPYSWSWIGGSPPSTMPVFTARYDPVRL